MNTNVLLIAISETKNYGNTKLIVITYKLKTSTHYMTVNLCMKTLTAGKTELLLRK